MKRLRPLLIAGALTLSTLTGGWVAMHQNDDDLFELKKNFEIFGALFEEIIINYVDDVRAGPFMRAGIDAMVSRLDPYTRYYDQAVNVDMDLIRRGPLGDVGLNIGVRMGRMTVLAPEAETRAYEQGVHVGDIILRIDGADISDLTVQDVAGLLRGDPGSLVPIDVERSGENRSLSFMLLRSVSRTENVSYAGFLDEDSTAGIAYVRLSLFGRRSAREVRRALREMARTAGLNAVVLDLRDNPGGILSEAIELVSLFVPKGTVVVSTRGRIENIAQTYTTMSDPFFEDVPVVVLVNSISASASEIVAGAMQDLDRGVIVGETTFGKGLVQIMRQLPYNTSMKITVGHYYTPSGRDIQSAAITSDAVELSIPDVQTFRTVAGRPVRSGVGIEPDVSVSGLSPSELVAALLREGAFFRFAGEHAAARELEAAPHTLLDEQKLFEAFEDWLSEIAFDYQSTSEIILDSLAAQLTILGYSNALRQLGEVREVAGEEKRVEIVRHRAAILAQLRKAIYGRYLTEPERVRRLLETDAAVDLARQLARSRSAYKELLGS